MAGPPGHCFRASAGPRVSASVAPPNSPCGLTEPRPDSQNTQWLGMQPGHWAAKPHRGRGRAAEGDPVLGV